MRIKGIQLAGLAVVLAGAATKDALAADVTVSTATTTPLSTSAPDGNSPGNVTVSNTGSITVTAGQSAVTVNSNNTVTNNGTIASANANNTTGILLQGGFTGSVVSSGTINLLEDYVLTDTAPTDGDLDGEWAVGLNRNGILLQAGPTFTGNIQQTGGAINIEGENSAGIRLDALLTGQLTSDGTITVGGDNGRGIAINGGAAGGVTGDVILRGSLQLRGENSVGVLVDAPIGGQLNINGGITISGFHSVTHPTSQTVIDALDADDLLLSGSAVAVHYSVGEGVVIEGIGIEDDEDDDGDGITEATGDTNDDATAAISVFTSAPAIWIAPSATTPTALVLGDVGNGYGFHNRGAVTSSGVYDGIESTALRIEGVGGFGVTTAGGVLNDGALGASAFEAESYGIYIGSGAVVPEIVTRRAISSRTVAETAQTSYGIFIASGATVTNLENSGIIAAQLLGEVGDAVAIIDQSNTLATITNSGAIQAQVLGTDSDLTDDVFPVVTGDANAIDLSASTIDITLRQIAPVVFTDDDAIDNDVNNLPPVRIVGNILFGSGNDTFDLLSGDVVGITSFGAGMDSLTIDNGATYLGRITDSDGQLTIDVLDGRLSLGGGTVNFTSGHFGADSELAVLLSTTPSESTLLLASGAVTFDAGAMVTPVIPLGLPDSGTQVFLTASGGLIGGANVERIITGAGAPFIYNLSIQVSTSVANSLEASYLLKTPTELGLNPNEAVAFSPIIEALRLDDDASLAFSRLFTETEFNDAYADLLPNYAAATAELATTAINQGQSAATNRLTTLRVREIDEVSVWAQEIGYGLNRTPESFGVEYRGFGFGLATGIDGPLDNGALFGLSASFVTTEAEEPGRVEGEISASFGQLNAYLGAPMGPIDLDFVAGAGVGKMTSRRFVAIGPDFEAAADAEWWAYEGHGAIRASMPLRAGWFLFTPQAALSYVAIAEDGYSEEGGGDAINYEVDSTVSQRLWGDVGVEFGARFRMGEASMFAPRLMLGYRANLIDEAAERTVRFAAGGSDFTLTDEALGNGAPLVGVGFDATNGFSTFSLSYEGEFGDQIERHSLNAALRFRF